MKRNRGRGGSAFLDTHALLAILNADDAHHDAATAALGEMIDEKTQFHTSEWVLAEFLSACARRPLRKPGIAAVKSLYESALTNIVRADHATFDQAWSLFRARPDKDWSLIDCTSIVLCKRLGVSRVFTADHHFRQAGFEIILR